MTTFISQYQENEDRKYVFAKMAHLDFINLEIKRFELLKTALEKFSYSLNNF